MKKTLLVTGSLISSFLIALPSHGENLADLKQLLNENQCVGCDLTRAGLVMSSLVGADLRSANLVGANLSRADLSGANLSGANLSGASLYGANLSGADLTGANLIGADLRNAYLVNTILTDTKLTNAYVQGAVGISEDAADAQQFYQWGLKEDQRGNYQAAFNHYNQAINLDPEFAAAYLGKAVIISRMGNVDKAIKEGEKAGELFALQENEEGVELSARFIGLVKARAEIEQDERENRSRGGGFAQVVNSLVPMLLRFVLP